MEFTGSDRSEVSIQQGRVLIEVEQSMTEEEALELLRLHPGSEVPVEALVLSLSLRDAHELAHKILALLDREI